MTSSEAAELLGLSSQRVLQLRETGRLSATWGRSNRGAHGWIFDRDEVEELKALRDAEKGGA